MTRKRRKKPSWQLNNALRKKLIRINETSRAAPLCRPTHKSRVIRNSSTRPSQRSNRKSLRVDWGPRQRERADPKVKPWAWRQAQRWMQKHSLCRSQTILIRLKSVWEAGARVIWCTLREAPRRRKRNDLVVSATGNSQGAKITPRRCLVRDHTSTSKSKALTGAWLMYQTAKSIPHDTRMSHHLWTIARMSSTSQRMSSHSSQDKKDPRAAALVWSSCNQLCSQVWKITTET